MKHLNKTLFAALLVGTLLLATSFTQAASVPSTNARQNSIVGIFDVEVSVNSCANGSPLFGFLAMHKFELGGTGQVVPATNPAALSAHMLIWEHLGGNNYRWAIKFFRFENGAPVGWNIIESYISLSEDGSLYGGSGVASLYDMNGNLQPMVLCPSFAGTRFTG
jgi:hypothetical protein